jgi:RNA polymerase sigma-70 factor (ECF subfamily)
VFLEFTRVITQYSIGRCSLPREDNSIQGSISEKDNVIIDGCLREMNEGLLVSAARSGDRTAFMELCGRDSSRIRGRIHRITRNREDTEDAFQNMLLRAFLNLKSFEGRSSFSSWLTRIAINSALGILRKRRTSELPILLSSDNSANWMPWEIPDQSETPEAYCQRREKEELLRNAILRLPSTFREVVELRHQRDYSTLEIAEALGISVSAVKSRLLRARKAVQLSTSGAARRLDTMTRSYEKGD